MHLIKTNQKTSFVIVFKTAMEAEGTIKQVFCNKDDFPTVTTVEPCVLHKADVRCQHKTSRIKDIEVMVGVLHSVQCFGSSVCWILCSMISITFGLVLSIHLSLCCFS